MADRKFSLIKQPGEKFTIGVDFANDLASGETIGTATMTCVDTSDNTDASATVFSGVYSIATGDATSSRIDQKIQAGTDGKEYKVTFKANTSSSNIFEADVYITVEEL